MGKFCDCAVGGALLGQANCDAWMRSWNRPIFKKILDSDGSPAKLDLSGAAGTFDQTFWDNLTSAVPLFDNRYIVGGLIDDLALEMQAAEVVETANKRTFTVHDGYTQVTWHVFGEGQDGASIDLFARYKTLECGEWGLLPIDDNGALAGNLKGTDMKPLPIDSVQVRKGFSMNSGTVAHVIVEFRIPHTFDWSNVKMFVPNVEAGDLDLLDLRPTVPLVANNIVTSNGSEFVTFTLFKSAAKFSAGNVAAGIPYLGLQQGQTQAQINGSGVAVVDLVESGGGTYVAELATPLTTGDVLTLKVAIAGYELLPVNHTV
jgi:hypothetical protein